MADNPSDKAPQTPAVGSNPPTAQQILGVKSEESEAFLYSPPPRLGWAYVKRCQLEDGTPFDAVFSGDRQDGLIGVVFPQGIKGLYKPPVVSDVIATEYELLVNSNKSPAVNDGPFVPTQLLLPKDASKGAKQSLEKIIGEGKSIVLERPGQDALQVMSQGKPLPLDARYYGTSFYSSNGT